MIDLKYNKEYITNDGSIIKIVAFKKKCRTPYKYIGSNYMAYTEKGVCCTNEDSNNILNEYHTLTSKLLNKLKRII